MNKKEIIKQNLNNILKETNFSDLGEKKVGKVRDSYISDDKIILISTDRHSSFDRIIAHIPFKGQILTQTSKFWFDQTKDIVDNHIIDIPDPNVVIGKKCKVVPVEVVPRGYITGVTGTALWTLYQKGQRDFGNFVLPEGVKKNQKLEKPVITPSTKFEEHDRTLSPQELIKEGLVEKDLWEKIEDIALRLFERGQKIAQEHGLILVDTKYEFGLDEENKLILIDEIHTSDSSRYWLADSYQEKFNKGEEPEYFDKEFLRIWFRDNCDPYKDEILPPAPDEMVVELASRYIDIYERITGNEFQFPDASVPILERIEKNIKDYLNK